jgi:hypothetical protein
MARADSRITVTVLLCSQLLLLTIAEGAPLPEPLFGKSVIVRWSNDRLNRFEGGRTAHVVFTSELAVYISTTGRAFTRYLVVSGKRGDRSGQALQSPVDSATSAGGSLVVRFEGGTLLVDTKLISGARRVAISFDSGYGRCSATVSFGREGGAPIRATDLISGKRFEVISTRTSVPVCSIRSGNVFDG